MKIEKPKKAKKITYSKAKTRAWDAFSLYIRQRDEEDGCFTCGVKKPYKQMQAGHWIPGRHNSILFNELGCHAQCYHCNVGLKGNPVKYYDRMLADYGKKVCEELKRMDKWIREYKVYELLEIEAKYKELC
jgi:hypothetical protein